MSGGSSGSRCREIASRTIKPAATATAPPREKVRKAASASTGRAAVHAACAAIRKEQPARSRAIGIPKAIIAASAFQ
jgi:hypothetical protein